MADYRKRDARNAETVRKFEEAKAAGRDKPVIRCRCCRRGNPPFLIEMGGFVFCDVCIEFAARLIAEQKGK